MSCPALFVTGTDTGVGKTSVACALAAAWRRAGLRVAVMKPIETGCRDDAGRLHPADGARLLDAVGGQGDLDLVCPIRFAAPASPAAAAALAGATIDFRRIDRAFAALSDGADLILVEGAGGLLVPITAALGERSEVGAADMAELAARLGARLLVVARASLGTVNHTLLTIEAAQRRRLPIVGVILNRVLAARGVDEASNAAAIVERARVPVFGTLPHLPGAPTAAALADAAAAHLDLDALLALARSAP